MGIGEPPPAHDAVVWATDLVELATSWVAYYENFGEIPLPKLSKQHGHVAGHLILKCAIQTRSTEHVTALINKSVPNLRKFGKEVAINLDRMGDGIHGLSGYFEMVAFQFENHGGNLGQFEGRNIPGAIQVKPRGSYRERAPSPQAGPHETDPSRVAQDGHGPATARRPCRTQEPAASEPLESNTAQTDRDQLTARGLKPRQVERILAVVTNLRKLLPETRLWKAQIREVGIPYSTIHSDQLAHAKGDDVLKSGDGIGTKAYAVNYVLTFALQRWTPRN